VPLIINFLITLICSFFLPAANQGLIILDLLAWMAITFVIFIITAFAAVQVGTVFDTVIFSLILNASAAASIIVVNVIAQAFLYGFYSSEKIGLTALKLSPVSIIIWRQAIPHNLANPINYGYFADNNIAILIWFIIGLVILFVSPLIYARRKSEMAESVGNMGIVQLFVRSIVTLVGGSTLGAALCAAFAIENKQGVLLCIAIGSILMYFICDIILCRSFRSVIKALPAVL
jgi:hypothetical protein